MRTGWIGFALTAVVAANDNDGDDVAAKANRDVVECHYPQSCYFMLLPLVEDIIPSTRGRSGGNATASATKTINHAFELVNDGATPQGQVAGQSAEPAPRFGAKIPIQLVANYGCWCYAGSQWPTGEGRSKPRDQHDDACKAHSMGMKCIEIDAEIENKQCSPYETDYDVTITQADYGTIWLECANSIEDDWCRRRVCMVELRLLARYWKLMSTGVWPEYYKWGHPSISGPFDPITNCEPSPGKEPIAMRCCGDYPYRSWYYYHVNGHDDGATQCCPWQSDKINEDYGFAINIGSLYNQFTQTCTANGVI